MAGDEVVQVYVRSINPLGNEPIHELCGFQRVHMVPGDAQTLTFEIAFSEFRKPDQTWKVAVGGRQPTLAEWEGAQDILVGSL